MNASLRLRNEVENATMHRMQSSKSTPFVTLSALILLGTLSFLVIPLRSLAHGSGESFEQKIGDYIVDVGYSSPIITVNESVRFDFNLQIEKDRGQVNFTDIWVRIAPKDGQGIVFAGPIHNPSFGLAGMTYTFGKAGPYELTLRFSDGSKSLAEASFPLNVAEVNDKPNNATQKNIGVMIMGFVIGAAAMFFFKK